jgi:hypothetical protein
MMSAVIARLAEPRLNLAAFGGVVFPVALLIEAPIIMMLAASTALSRDRDSFVRLRRFAVTAGAALTGLHALIAFTPLFDLVVVRLINPPEEIIESARLGLRVITPWTLMISDRRFHQGVLIQSGHSRAVGVGTLVRLVATSSSLATGYWWGWEGCAVACAALVAGVTSEMVFVRRLLAFYIPLALTPLLNLAAQPIGSAAMSRMPESLSSLAVWPVTFGLIFMLRAVGIAYNEVVVSHAGAPRARRVLGRFGLGLGLGCVSLLLLMASTPLSSLWFERVAGLDAELVPLAISALWAGLLLPAMTAAHSYYQGLLVHAHRTRGVTESVVVFLVVTTIALWAGERLGSWPGVVVALSAFTLGSGLQAVWLAIYVRRARLPHSA